MTTLSPADIAAVQAMTPEQYTEFIARLARELPTDILIEERKKALRIIAADADGYENFLAYYELIHGNTILEHNKGKAEECFQAHEDGEIFLYLGFRGCRKTTTFDVTLCSFLHGHHPELTGIITGANDPNAKLIAKSIAQIIENHPEFKMVFPYITIDKDLGWGAEGYWIRRTHKTVDGKVVEISRGEWTAQQAKVNDPSFVGGGYKSSEINGKHPTLYLAVDDLHDIDSSSSTTEREAIKMVFLTQILKTVLREHDKLLTRVIMTGVPFAKDDTYAVLKQSGGTHFTSLPVMKRAPEGQGAYIDGINPKTGVVYEDIVGWWFLTWAENFGVKSIINARSEGKSAFWQMFMLDIEIAKTSGLRYYSYDEDPGFELPMVGGADPTNVAKDTEVGGKKRSKWALCHLGKLPQGGAVVVDGVLRECGITGAKDDIKQAQTIYRNWRTTGVENVGGGAVFIQYLRTDSSIRVVDSGLTWEGKGRMKSKPDRVLLELSPWLENAVIRISSRRSPYLDTLRRGLNDFFDLAPDDEAWDVLDSLYHAAKLIPEVLRTPVTENLNPHAMAQRGGLYHPLAGGKPHGR
jgi:hypothetical protein